MQRIHRNETDEPWTMDEAELYAKAHNLTVIAINGHTLIVA